MSTWKNFLSNHGKNGIRFWSLFDHFIVKIYWKFIQFKMIQFDYHQFCNFIFLVDQFYNPVPVHQLMSTFLFYPTRFSSISRTFRCGELIINQTVHRQAVLHLTKPNIYNLPGSEVNFFGSENKKPNNNGRRSLAM